MHALRTEATWVLGLLGFLAAGGLCLAQDAPALPAGLEESPGSQPSLPEGLGEDTGAQPALPAGLEGEGTPETPAGGQPAKSYLETLHELGFSGFWEARGGVRTQHDPYEKQASIGETRMRLEWQKTVKNVSFKFSGDVLYDQVYNHMSDVNLWRGSGWFDLREAWTQFSPVEWMDVKIGRQVLTWGTGDLLFVNDLFPKDWQSFFIGRDLEYLKAPSDAVKMSLYSQLANLDVVFSPRFNPSRYITGQRLSYYNRNLLHLAGQDAVIQDELPDVWFEDSEWAGRAYQKLGSYELAAYGYWGYWKTPEGYDPIRQRATFPRLNTYGGSVRGPLGRGIANFEGAYYDSRDDRKGDNPLIRNGEVRLLGGYEMDLPEIASDLTVGAQYYVEIMTDYDAYRRVLPAGTPPADHARQVVTFSATKKLMNQNLILSLFTYYSPTDDDAYLRPKVQYKIDDHWTVEVGGNVFIGAHDWTFFGQFEQDTNVYGSLRYGW